ncbi:MAG: ribonuclease P protein component [Sphingobacteriales bacterium]|nr:MAG: ribonuclease P protein component [Sphingobacteriales bacterium]TAF79655.1 MAG: ribonuclease P protein component [Sphingobacteriales bacterium]
MPIKKTFCKEERLCSKVLLDALYAKSSSFLVYPYRVSWLLSMQPQLFPAKVVIGVSKKKFKRSVDRNLIKRKTREAYRKNKQELLYNPLMVHNCAILLAINYIGKDIVKQHIVDAKIKIVFSNLLTQINASHD